MAKYSVTIVVTSSVALIKAPILIRNFKSKNVESYVIMTKRAAEMLHPMVMQWACKDISMEKIDHKDSVFPINRVITNLSGNSEHLILSKLNALVIFPATANFISKIANGIADDAPSSTVLSAIGNSTPIFIAPAMHGSMWRNKFFQENLRKLEQMHNITIIPPRLEENTATEHEIVAKVATVDKTIHAVMCRLTREELKVGERKIVITFGRMEGKIDAVRSITNTSTGSLGTDITKYFYSLNYTIIPVVGKLSVPKLPEVNYRETDGFDGMLEAVLEECKDTNALIMNAAVLDYVPETILSEKVESGQEEFVISLKPTKKIVNEVRRRFPKLPIVIFKLERKPKEIEEFIKEKAKKYLQERKMSVIVFNFLEELGTNYYIVSEKESHIINKTSRPELASKLEKLLKEYW